jgi:hypothetical protein
MSLDTFHLLTDTDGSDHSDHYHPVAIVIANLVSTATPTPPLPLQIANKLHNQGSTWEFLGP